MVKSMTGYGRCQETVDGMNVTVEIKSVNHRYFDFSSRVPRNYGFLDEKLKSFVQSKVSRGKIECYVQVDNLEDDTVVVEVNKSLAAGYVKAFNELSETYGIENNINAGLLARMNDVLVVRKAEADEDKIWNAVKTVAEKAVEKFINMRQLERMQELLGDIHVEEARLLTEAAIYADKIAVAEETVRLRSHISQLKDFFNSTEAVGRKMDFLVQEINREANTIGSKANDVEIARRVLEIKSEVEKIREQVQNIE